MIKSLNHNLFSFIPLLCFKYKGQKKKCVYKKSTLENNFLPTLSYSLQLLNFSLKINLRNSGVGGAVKREA